MALSRTQRKKDSTIVVIDKFSKIANLISCQKIGDTSKMANLFFKEIVRLHSIPRTILFNHDTKVISYFSMTLQSKLGTKLLFSTSHYLQTDGQTKVTNRILGTHLMPTVNQCLKDYDLKLV